MIVFWITLALTLLLLAGLTYYFVHEHRSEERSILQGDQDSSLYAQELRERERNERPTASGRVRRLFGYLLDAVLLFLALIFLLSLADRTVNSFDLPFQSAVIASGSMSRRNPENEYLFEHDLDDQLQVNDWIALRGVDSLDEIELYDIVAYVNEDGIEIVHRVIEKGDGFLTTRGDDVESSDSQPVRLSDIVGVYTGFRIPHVGFFVFFAQSEYGILAFASVFYLLILYEFLSNRILLIKASRTNYLKSAITKDNFILKSESGELSSDGSYFVLDDEKEKEGGSLLQMDDQEIPLPESDYKQWKTN